MFVAEAVRWKSASSFAEIAPWLPEEIFNKKPSSKAKPIF